MSDDLNHVIDVFTVTKKSKKASLKSKFLSSFILMKIQDLSHERGRLSRMFICKSITC